ncbi:MAG: hypothetical protein A2758_02240 [Candidatus Zambryskibacteria bacterium RIFCSPHIGHO2_01_FULL_49_18]|uniref:Pyridoxamine 5'-phosphate oxidase N-terminal domain-containing protein n=2 Tax=Candidatus Zambryskiibacteriota TaxID=1817925 RepID=A0A1G2T2A2_9BACT|nr:MAG: hypothetical protein A2758_02240 [Candidatus Zambryskibacteria bacterium RIFCSPHIGHO2_01_FULL_49_18]OHB06143.1 MAG: hypothetical protein A3A26_01200 [Candidatus Zambryskibacteria bacterium RIFCSPLOWO2_01_FULL_47_14]
MDIKPKIREVLEKGHLMSLGTIDDGGVWVSDVIYVYDDDFNIYWMSDPDVRHSKAILKNSQAAGSITISNKSKESNLGIQFAGKVEQLEGVQFNLSTKHFSKRGHPMPSMSEVVNFLSEDRWYKLTPARIDLIDEEHFGFDKKSIDL